MEAERRQKEQRDFGVFFDDDYNYLQHLKERGPAVEWVANKPSGKRPLDLRSEEEEEDEEEEDEQRGPAVPVSLITR